MYLIFRGTPRAEYKASYAARDIVYLLISTGSTPSTSGLTRLCHQPARVCLSNAWKTTCSMNYTPQHRFKF
ncbi:uncharacterized protein PHALS_01262 [Plasmopara halstedii]|uniref:Uncharacterized protein n=1 Tax=Plasmopara halstedii TaxID=4781 RepID=A0A0N7L6Q6_PLAHL|nr:uncharacterized protein PHALS_01262 [Plasmopara halstedii]CEG44939.1 hypothetical protein PHALS_01262 [Plasmopara halstedii]|eukprot:XP_024581308.1 hypothetical protein PHALS_01262 [Plasmopara halstedii]